MGYLFAFFSAIAWTTGTIVLVLSNHRLSPHLLNLYKNLLGFISLFIILVIFTLLLPGDFWIITNESFLLIILSGILGSGLADQIYIRSLSNVGSNLISVIASSLSIFVLFFALLLNLLLPSIFPEQLWPPKSLEILGFLFIISAIIYSSWDKKEYQNIKIKNILMAISAFMLMGLSANLTNSAIHLNEGSALNILVIILVRFIPAILFQIAILFFNHKTDLSFKNIFDLSRKNLFLVSLGSLMISVVAIFFWVVGMKIESSNMALFSLLAQTSNIMIFICSWLFLKEKITNKRILGILLSFVGIMLIIYSK